MEKLKDEIQQFWTRNPCARNIVDKDESDKEFFILHDQIIDRMTPYHHEIYKYESCKGNRVLEIGCGMGSHAWRFARYADKFYAIDLSPKSIELTTRRFELYNIKNAHIRQGDAEKLDFPDNFFDRVYSNGVIHHTPNTIGVVREICRVLKPGGQVTVMIYNKSSIFYWYNLMFVARPKYAIFKIIPREIIDILFKKNQSIIKLKKTIDETPWDGLADLVLRFSDGHYNPHTKVYSRDEAAKLFSQFKEVRTELRSPSDHFMERVSMLGRYYGWALFVHAKK